MLHRGNRFRPALPGGAIAPLDANDNVYNKLSCNKKQRLGGVLWPCPHRSCLLTRVQLKGRLTGFCAAHGVKMNFFVSRAIQESLGRSRRRSGREDDSASAERCGIFWTEPDGSLQEKTSCQSLMYSGSLRQAGVWRWTEFPKKHKMIGTIFGKYYAKTSMSNWCGSWKDDERGEKGRLADGKE